MLFVHRDIVSSRYNKSLVWFSNADTYLQSEQQQQQLYFNCTVKWNQWAFIKTLNVTPSTAFGVLWWQICQWTSTGDNVSQDTTSCSGDMNNEMKTIIMCG